MANIGIIGTGWGARVQVPAFRQAGHRITAIAGAHPRKTLKTAEELDIPASFDHWEELLRSSDVDLVTIATPPRRHAEIAIAALEQGKHALSEKPTAMNAAEAELMLRAAQAHPAQLALLDHELRFLPSWFAARDHFEEILPLRYIEIRYSSPSRGDRAREWNWWSDAQAGGGILGAIGSHLVDSIRYFAGEITDVQALIHTFITERPAARGEKRPVTSDDFTAMNLRLADGVLATLTMTVVAAVDEPTTMTFHGEGGGIRLLQDRLLTARRAGSWQEVFTGEKLASWGDSSGGFFGTGTVHFARAIAAALDHGDHAALAPAATFLDGLRQQQVLDAAKRSAGEEGRWVAV